jgi:hypothetical protein
MPPLTGTGMGTGTGTGASTAERDAEVLSPTSQVLRVDAEVHAQWWAAADAAGVAATDATVTTDVAIIGTQTQTCAGAAERR